MTEARFVAAAAMFLAAVSPSTFLAEEQSMCLDQTTH
jgi:hypothetical protein